MNLLTLKRKPENKALVLGFIGELGSGKTTFIKAFVRELGVKKRVTSPTFIIVKRFHIPGKTKYKNVFHIDAYRVSKRKELFKAGVENAVNEPSNIVLVEWADKAKGILPKETTWIKLKHGKKQGQREIIIN